MRFKKKNRYFAVFENKIKFNNTKVDGRVEIDFYLTKHKIISSKNMITLCITESKGAKVAVLLEKEFSLSESDYINEGMDNGDRDIDSNKARYQLREMVLNCIDNNK